MKTAGIIAEYNPFHRGHQYQIDAVRARTGADFIVVAMSGDFVQRGEPAVFDKYTRTRMALSCGAALVLELPVAFATSSAEDFAACGVALLDKLGAVDILCFGSELGELGPLAQAADILDDEPEEFKGRLRELLKRGLSYPAARYAALSDHGVLKNPLSSPNNILAVEYLKALKRRKSAIAPVTIRREGQGYHELEAPERCLPSASAIRKLILEGKPGRWRALLPEAALAALLSEGAEAAPIRTDDMSLLLQYRLLESVRDGRDLSRYADLSPELAMRLEKSIPDVSGYSGCVTMLKTRGYTYTRVSRALLHLVLGITADDVTRRKEQDYVSYARILGFRRRAAELLGEIKKSAAVPLITKTADAKTILPPEDLRTLNQDIFASHLYRTLVLFKGRAMKNEYTKSVIILD